MIHPSAIVSPQAKLGKNVQVGAWTLIADDVENVNNSMTQGQRDKLSELVKEFDACITPEKGRIIFLGTPQTENSLYDVLPQYNKNQSFNNV